MTTKHERLVIICDGGWMKTPKGYAAIINNEIVDFHPRIAMQELLSLVKAQHEALLWARNVSRVIVRPKIEEAIAAYDAWNDGKDRK